MAIDSAACLRITGARILIRESYWPRIGIHVLFTSYHRVYHGRILSPPLLWILFDFKRPLEEDRHDIIMGIVSDDTLTNTGDENQRSKDGQESIFAGDARHDAKCLESRTLRACQRNNYAVLFSTIISPNNILRQQDQLSVKFKWTDVCIRKRVTPLVGGFSRPC